MTTASPRSPSHRLVCSVLVAGALAAAGEPGVAQATLYATGFEPPTFAPGLLHGQDGWYVFDGISLNAATVSPGLPRSGVQSMRFDAAQLENFPGIGNVGFAVQDLVYDPLAAGTRFVDLAADIHVVRPDGVCPVAFPLGDPGSCAIGIALDGPGYLPLAVITLNIGAGAVMARNLDAIAALGPAYAFGEWAHLRARFDFQDRTMRGYFNGAFFGAVPFTAGVDASVVAIDIGLGVLTPSRVAGLVVHIDNLSVTAVPEPRGAAVLAAGLLALAGVARRQRAGLTAEHAPADTSPPKR
jgi:hypothetical protein